MYIRNPFKCRCEHLIADKDHYRHRIDLRRFLQSTSWFTYYATTPCRSFNLIEESFYYEPQEEHDKGMVIVGVEGACSSWHLETIIKKPSVKIVSGGKETSYFCLLEKQLPVGDKLWRWRGHEPLAVRGWGSRRTNPTDPNPIQDYRWSDTKCKNRNRN